MNLSIRILLCIRISNPLMAPQTFSIRTTAEFEGDAPVSDEGNYNLIMFQLPGA